MSGGRPYPQSVAGPFPVPPRRVTVRPGWDIAIHVLDPSDSAVDDLLTMYEHFEPGDRAQGIPPATRSAIEAWLSMVLRSGPDLIARHDGQVVGHATLVYDCGEEYELAIFVDAGHQGNGIGTALIETLLGYAADSGINRVWLTVERWNIPAISLYEKVGFQSHDHGSFELEMTLRLG